MVYSRKEDFSEEGYQHIDRLIERLHRVKPRYVMLSDNVWAPNIDVFVAGKDIIVKVDLAGVDKNKVRVRLKERLLTIEGYRIDMDEGRRAQFIQMEIDYGRFFRQIDLPVEVIGEKTQASYEAGFLLITMPIALPDNFQVNLK